MNVLQILPHGGRAPGQPQIVAAKVSWLQPAPSSFTDPLFVTIDDLDPNTAYRIDSTHWWGIHGATLPALGADVLLLIDDHGVKWIVGWSGVYSA